MHNFFKTKWKIDDESFSSLKSENFKIYTVENVKLHKKMIFSSFWRFFLNACFAVGCAWNVLISNPEMFLKLFIVLQEDKWIFKVFFWLYLSCLSNEFLLYQWIRQIIMNFGRWWSFLIVNKISKDVLFFGFPNLIWLFFTKGADFIIIILKTIV